MSFQAMAWAVKQVLPAREKLVLLMAANYADEYGKCWPSNGRLMQDTGLTKNTITAAFKELEARGLLQIQHRSIEGVSLSNMYHLNLQGVVSESDQGEGSGNDRGGSKSVQGVGQEMTGGGSGNDPKPIKEPIKESISAFEDFWRAYPRRIAKEAARKAWLSVTKKTAPADIISGLARYTFSTDSQFIPHPATWLNQHRWADEGVAGAIGQPKREMTREEQIEASKRFWAQYEGGKQ